jgi:hypothetical protein
MTTYTPSPEAVEAAAKAMADDWNPDRDPILTAMFRDYAMSALTAALPHIATPALPSVEDVARALFDAEYHDIDATERNIEWGVVNGTDHARKHGTAWHRQARAVLALLPGRTEAEVKAEALREARNAWPVVTRDMVSRGQVRNWLGERADHIEKEADRG